MKNQKEKLKGLMKRLVKVMTKMKVIMIRSVKLMVKVRGRATG